MIIVEPDGEPTHVSASTGWPDGCAVAHKHRLYWSSRARRAASRLREALTGLSIRAVSAPLRLSWRLDVTVGVDAEIDAADGDSARAALQRFLHAPQTRIVMYAPDRGPTGWRELANGSVDKIHPIVAEPDDIYDPPTIWMVSTTVTSSMTAAPHDAAHVDRDSDVDITPFVVPSPIRHVIASNQTIRRTPVRRIPHPVAAAPMSLPHMPALEVVDVRQPDAAPASHLPARHA
ncbi:hypothetical protein [Virgisporangium aurantiacum]|uniref:hypothetical protein n=1 Tax=Virgisporangium aurantiacum TaxID=175570 RepID=UPI00194EBDA7|nr:hypothetical protein [Virgisporangium aurantiacum]